MSALESTFQSLQAEWADIRGRVRANVAHWEQHVADFRFEEAALRDAGKWIHGRSDFLGVLCRNRDELLHSRVIAWLLDPCARHGLGTAVLAGVVHKVCGTTVSPVSLARARIRCEVPLHDGRLDIVVQGPGFHLVIENKVDAEEGDGQCASYSKHLPADALCVLLSPDGRPSKRPSSFRSLRYSDLKAVLRSALDNAPPNGSGRLIAEDYLRTLDMEFP